MRVLNLFCRKNVENFDILHAFLGLSVTKLSSLKTVRFFGPPCIIQDSCSWSDDKTYDTRYFVRHGNMRTLGSTCHTRAAPSCDMFNLGSSYFHVALTTVRHLLNVNYSSPTVCSGQRIPHQHCLVRFLKFQEI